MYIFNVEQVGFIGLFLFDDQFETKIDKPNMLRKNLEPSLVRIEDGQIRIIRNLKRNEYKGEFQDQNSGRKYMKISVNGINKTIYFDTFYSMKYQDILNLLNEGKRVSNDLLFACFMRHTDEIAAIVELMSRDTLLFGCMSMCSPDRTKKVLCVPKATEQYPMDMWHYKMTFAPIQESMSIFTASMTTYTSDICSMINNGNIKLVNKQEYIDKLNEASSEVLKKVSKKRFFKRNMKGVDLVEIPMLYENGYKKITALQTELLEEGISCLISNTLIA